MGGCETAPVLAVLVCRNGAGTLAEVLASLRKLTVGPRRLVAVDLASTDRTPEILAEGPGDVLSLPRGTSFGAAVDAAVGHVEWSVSPASDEEALSPVESEGSSEGDEDSVPDAESRFRWVWVLHDDSVPEPDCLEKLLAAGALDEAGVLGPSGLAADDSRFVSDAGLSLDSGGHRRSRMHSFSVDPAIGGPGSSQVAEVLAVSMACALIRRDVYDRLGGLTGPIAASDEAPSTPWDRDEDIDFGWRVNAVGMLVLHVPPARMCHGDPGRVEESRCPGTPPTVLDARRVGVRTYLLNVTPLAFLLGLPRLCVLALLRGMGFGLQRRLSEARAEFVVAWQLATGRMDLRRRRALRRGGDADASGRRIRGLLTSRSTRMHNGAWSLFAALVRGRVHRELLLGRETGAQRPHERSLPTVDAQARCRPRGGAFARSGPVVVPVGFTPPGAAAQVGAQAGGGITAVSAPVEPAGDVASPRPRPSPAPREHSDLLLVPVNARGVLRELFLTPVVVMVAALVLTALVTHGLLAEFPRAMSGLTGGRLLPVADLGRVVGDYVAAWHPVAGGTATPASPALLVLAAGGAVLAPIGGPSTFLALLILAEMPLAGVTAYVSTRGVAVSRWARASAAGAYAVFPAAALSTSEGRVGVTVVHILLPLVLAGLAAVLGLARLAPMAVSRHWLTTTCLTAFGLYLVGAFSPPSLVMLLLLTLLGYVFVPGAVRAVRRRLASLVLVVFLPIMCSLPWMIGVVDHPQFLLHGLGVRTPGEDAGFGLLLLNPNGSVAGWAGGVLVVGAVIAVFATARNVSRVAIPGMVVAVVGWAAAVVVETTALVPIGGGPAVNGWAGEPLLLVAAGLLWIVLVCDRPGWVTMPVLIAALLVLTTGAVLAGRSGPLRAAPSEEAVDGTVLIVEPGPAPARLADGRAHFGDADLVPSAAAANWLRHIDDELLSGEPERVKHALAGASVRGVEFVATPSGSALSESAPDLVGPHGSLDGAELVQLNRPSGPMSLLGPDLSRQARDGVEPSPRAHPVPVSGSLPNVVVRVSEGGAGRTLAIAAANEPGWRAEIDGRPVALASAWNGFLGVPLPEHASEVKVSFTDAPRTLLLVIQVGAILVTLIGAIPESRRRRW